MSEQLHLVRSSGAYDVVVTVQPEHILLGSCVISEGAFADREERREYFLGTRAQPSSDQEAIERFLSIYSNITIGSIVE